MSRHYYDTFAGNEPVTVVAGWDKFLFPGFFLDIMRHVKYDGEHVFLYENLKGIGPQPSFEPLMEILSQFGIALPEKMIDELLNDESLDVGNKWVRHQLINGRYVREEGELKLWDGSWA